MSVAELEEVFGLRLSIDQKTALRRYLELLRKWNRRINLAGRENTRELLQFHFFESFWATGLIPASTGSLVDIGSGAGFPGLAMKIYRPGLDVTLIERAHKKATFLRHVAAALALPARVEQVRAEEYRGWPRTGVATLRALRPSGVLLEVLARHHIELLHFHGSSPDAALKRFRRLQTEAVPGSEQRFVSRYHCST